MSILRFAVGANYKRFFDNITEIAKREHKTRYVLLIDSALSTVIYGSGLTDYLNYEFYKLSPGERRKYATIRTQDKFYEKVCPSEYKKVFTVKPNFLRAFKKYTNRDFILPEDSSVDELKKFLEKNEHFMEKPLDGVAGHGIKRIKRDDITDINEYFRYLGENRLFIEQYIVQHKDISAICSQSVNTLRVLTSTASGTPEILFAALRVGNGEYALDNFHCGGMAVAVDIENGKLVGNAVNKNLVKFDCHPKTGFKFDGFIIPHWEEVKKVVKEASLVEPRIMVIGWDVAITENGPVFVEGNRRPGFDLIQVVARRGRKDIIKKVLYDVKNRK